MTTQRLNYFEVDPKAGQAVLAMENYVRESGLDTGLYELIKIRASQLNGCAFCLDMHHRDARKNGEDQRRLDILGGWREASGFFSEAERAALALTEEVTLIGENGVSDEVWDAAAAQFSQEQLVQVLLAIATINVWNRLAVTTHQALPDDPGA